MRQLVGDVPLGGSPFPPIAEFAFLSDTECTALVAPSGNVEWMCVPRMDGPSVFGSLLDRDAGGFRLGPADQTVPAGRRYLPGTMVLETTWGTRTGWVIVRDVLLIGPWHHEDERSHTHRRSPTDYDADHVLLRMLRCVNGQVEINLDCVPVMDYGRRQVELGLRRRRLPQGGGHGEGLRPRADAVDRPAAGVRGLARTGAHHDARRRPRLRGVVLERARRARELRGRLPAAGAHRRLLARVAFARRVSRPPVADPPAAQRADAEGADLRADRGDVRGGYHVAARDAGRRAQLGLPLLVDPRLHVHVVGPLHARLRLGGQRLLLLHPRRGLGRRPAAGDVRPGRRARARGARARSPVGLRGRPAGADRQRRVGPEATRRVGRAAGLDLPAHQVARQPSGVGLADHRQGRRMRDRPLEGARSRHLGGARRSQALRVVEGLLLGGVRPRCAAGARARGLREREEVAGGRRRDPRGRLRERGRRARRVHPALRDRRAGRGAVADAAGALPAARRRAREGDRHGDLQGADGRRAGAALQGRRDRRRPVGRGGHFRDLLVLARSAR